MHLTLKTNTINKVILKFALTYVKKNGPLKQFWVEILEIIIRVYITGYNNWLFDIPCIKHVKY